MIDWPKLRKIKLLFRGKLIDLNIAPLNLINNRKNMNFQQVAIIQAPEIRTNFNNKTDIHKREKSICLGIKLE